MTRRSAHPLRYALALVAAVSCVAPLAPYTASAASSAPTVRQAPAARPVPVPNGRYGFAAIDDPELMTFKVRHRTLIDPRFSIAVYCHASDGETQQLIYGPISSDPSRRFPIERDGSGRVSWVQEFDSSLVPNASIEINYTFRRHRSTLASAYVDSEFTDSGVVQTCFGQRSFRLAHGPLR